MNLIDAAAAPQNAARWDRAAEASYTVERLGASDFRESLHPEWQALHDGLKPSTPFTSPLWNTLWWEHFGDAGRWRRNELLAYAVRDSNDRLIAVAPLMLTKTPAFGPVKVRAVRAFGADPNITEIRAVICKPHAEVGVLERLSSELQRTIHFDWIDWGTVREGNWPDLSVTAAQGRLKPGRSVVDYHLELPGSWEEFRRTRSPNVREAIRKCYKSLARDGLKPELRVITAANECEAAVRTFLTLHEQRSEALDMVRHANVFASDRGKAFLLDYVRAMASSGRLRIFELCVGGSVVASRIGFLLGDELYLYYSGFQTVWARYSVMTTLLVEAIKWAIDNRLTTVNLSTGTDVSKLRWRPVATEYRSVLQIRRGVRSLLSYSAYEWRRSERERR